MGRPKAVIQHGTCAGYVMELHRGLPSCEPCRAARRQYKRQRETSESHKRERLRKIRILRNKSIYRSRKLSDDEHREWSELKMRFSATLPSVVYSFEWPWIDNLRYVGSTFFTPARRFQILRQNPTKIMKSRLTDDIPDPEINIIAVAPNRALARFWERIHINARLARGESLNTYQSTGNHSAIWPAFVKLDEADLPRNRY